MLSIDYSGEDAARTRFAVSPVGHLLHGLISGVGRLPCGTTSVQQRWWRDAGRLVPAKAAPLVDLLRATPTFIPDFLFPELDPYPGRTRRGLDDELQALRALTEDGIEAQMARFEADSGLRPPLKWERLRDHLDAAVPQLVEAARALFDACLSSDWADMQRRLDAEIAARGRQMASGGIAAVLDDLHPRLSWTGTALVYDTPNEHEPQPGPGGRGYVLMPDLMEADVCNVTPPHRQQLFLYAPGHHAPAVGTRTDGLAALIGQRKAKALRAVGNTCTTAELAASLGVKASTASEHLTALREAGLTSSVRQGRFVRHTLTELGAGLLGANPL